MVHKGRVIRATCLLAISPVQAAEASRSIRVPFLLALFCSSALIIDASYFSKRML